MYRFMYPFLLALSFGIVEAKSVGTVVVTYHTGRNNERVDRVHVRLTNDRKQQLFYPQGSSYCEDGISHVRRIVIPDLPVGHYTLEFLVPNYDGLFADVPSRDITVTNGSILTIDQEIKPRYGSMHGEACFPETQHRKDLRPHLILFNEWGRIHGESSTGELYTQSLPPGNYTLVFDPIPGYQTPVPIHFHLRPGDLAGPFQGLYTQTR